MGEARLPDKPQFQPPQRVSDFPTWLPPFVQRLNQFLTQTVDALRSLRDAAPTYRVLILETDSVTPIYSCFPVTSPNPLPDDRKPVDVRVAKVLSRPGDVLSDAISVSWELTTDGDLRVLNVTGLNPDGRYVVTLAVA